MRAVVEGVLSLYFSLPWAGHPASVSSGWRAGSCFFFHFLLFKFLLYEFCYTYKFCRRNSIHLLPYIFFHKFCWRNRYILGSKILFGLALLVLLIFVAQICCIQVLFQNSASEYFTQVFLYKLLLPKFCWKYFLQTFASGFFFCKLFVSKGCLNL